MPWFKVDDGLSTKLETTRIPRAHRAAAIGLWTLAGSWSARELTDGHVPAHMIDELAGTQDDAQWLVSAGFWMTVEDGFQFVVWDGEQPMRSKVLEAREKNTAKVQSWRSRNRVTNQGTNLDVTAPPTRPDPTRPDPVAQDHSPVDEAFERAWSHWPKRVERKRSHTAFAKIAKSKPLAELEADVIRFGDAYRISTEARYVPALVVWLNGERWTDDLPDVPAPSDREWNTLQPLGGRPTRDDENLAVVARLAAREAAEQDRRCPSGHPMITDRHCAGGCLMNPALEAIA